MDNLVENCVNIKMVGHVKGSEKAKLFKESHIFCLPSYSEGLPNSVLEAMAFGLPVITTEVGGLKHFFHDNKMGFFVAPGSIHELKEKLEILILDKEKMVEIGKYNYNYAHEKLLNNVVVKRISNQLIKVSK